MSSSLFWLNAKGIMTIVSYCSKKNRLDKEVFINGKNVKLNIFLKLSSNNYLMYLNIGVLRLYSNGITICLRIFNGIKCKKFVIQSQALSFVSHFQYAGLDISSNISYSSGRLSAYCSIVHLLFISNTWIPFNDELWIW